jgi:hypothetical protein
MINIQQYWNSGMSWGEYRKLVDDLLARGLSTGENNSPEMVDYAKLNQARMQRLEKHSSILPEALQIAGELPGGMRILVIAEGWCGDAAQVCPPAELLFQKLNISTRYVLRDKDTTLIDMFLTHGGRSIPVFIPLDEAGNVLGEKWGPRPAALQQLRAGWVAEGLPFEKQAELLHGWYARDKTISTQHELLEWLKGLAHGIRKHTS